MPRGMALTLNGVAQGIITDRIAELLAQGGARQTLIDMGEIRALDGQPDGQPWRVTFAGGLLDIAAQAVATTEAAGFTFDPAGQLPHLIDPVRRAPHAEWSSLAVIAPQAGLADALSTGFALTPASVIEQALRGLPGVTVHGIRPGGQRLRLG